MGRPEIESTDHLEGIAPVPKRVRLDPRKPGKIIAVPKLLKSNMPVDLRLPPFLVHPECEFSGLIRPHVGPVET